MCGSGFCHICGVALAWQECPECKGKGVLVTYQDSTQREEKCLRCGGAAGWDDCPAEGKHEQILSQLWARS